MTCRISRFQDGGSS